MCFVTDGFYSTRNTTQKKKIKEWQKLRDRPSSRLQNSLDDDRQKVIITTEVNHITERDPLKYEEGLRSSKLTEWLEAMD